MNFREDNTVVVILQQEEHMVHYTISNCPRGREEYSSVCSASRKLREIPTLATLIVG